jgi:hypothetical protein
MGAIILPSRRIAKEFARFHDKLREVFNSMLDSAWPEHADVFITSIYRSKEEDAAVGGQGIHHSIPHRACDIRIHPLLNGEKVTVVTRLNNQFAYDPKRPKLSVALIHDAGSGVHLHLQVSDFTTGRNSP